ncbi:hypothetical protein M434DRAFT_402130 [Hypoxylon sp. CO27-5]|nr:hypothetical protein M434DRAFT_402130 [Hypoxylon sp. CO27-5]
MSLLFFFFSPLFFPRSGSAFVSNPKTYHSFLCRIGIPRRGMERMAICLTERIWSLVAPFTGAYQQHLSLSLALP